MALAISGRIFSPLFCVLVVISHFSTFLPSFVKYPSLTVVPPKSTPNAYFPFKLTFVKL
jgi:hypothetical protein